MSAPFLKTFRQLWWAPLVCFGLAYLGGRLDTLQEMEWHSLDWRTRFRLDFQPPPDPRLAVVLFDDDTEVRLEDSWPVGRQWHAEMSKVLTLAGAKVVAWDVIFDSKFDVRRGGDGDATFGQVAALAREEGTHLVTGSATFESPTGAIPGTEGPTKALPNVTGDIRRIYGDQHALVPYPELRAASLYGFVDAHPSSDGVRRRVPLLVRIGESVFPSFALQVVLAYHGVKVETVQVKLGRAISFPMEGRTVEVPIDDEGQFWVNYRYDQLGHSTDLPTYGYGKLLISLSQQFLTNEKPSTPPPDLKGRIVFLGQVVKGKADIGPTALRDLSPLTNLQANLVSNLLLGDFLRRWPEWQAWLLLGVLGYLWVFFVEGRSVLILCGGAVMIWLAIVSAALWSWVWGSVWLPMVAPLLGFGMLQFLTIGRRVWEEQKAKQEIKGMFGSYLSPDVVNQLIKSEEKPRLGGHEEEITAYFSDIQGYSSFSEKLSPDRLVELLNEYLTVCTDTLQEEQGTLDKYIGDAVVAMFGAPLPLPDHAYRACVAAVRVQERLGELRTKWNAAGDLWPDNVRKMRSRIGLNSGPAIIGNMGSRTRFSYTMTGDNVNLAARMESGAKSWGVYTMCTESTKLGCEKHGGDHVVFRPLARLVVMGRSLPVPVYEIVGLKESVSDQTRECIAIFSAALERYYARDWEGALAGFKRSALLEPNQPGVAPGVKDNASLVYQEIVLACLRQPPPENWDGTYVMSKK